METKKAALFTGQDNFASKSTLFLTTLNVSSVLFFVSILLHNCPQSEKYFR